MCCCGKPTINGEPGYSWDGKTSSVRRVDPPELKDGDELLYDEPGRCGVLDSHSHHIRLVKGRHRNYALLVRNGSGDHRISLGCVFTVAMKSDALGTMDSNARYWFLLSIHNEARAAASDAVDKESAKWRQAAADKRIKTRKLRGRNDIKVWIEPAVQESVAQ